MSDRAGSPECRSRGAGTVLTDDGVALAAEWAVPDTPVAAAVLMHPHPLLGGDMRTPVPDALFRELPGHGVAAWRFDFRGAGRSDGDHGGGPVEALDVQANLGRLSELVPDVPLWLVGWSFGADVSLQVIDPVVAGWVLVAPPLAVVAGEDMVAAHDPRPKLLLVPEHDQYRDPSGAASVTAAWAATSVQVVPGTDHFLAGRLGLVSELVVATLTRSAPGPD
jgi:uncharacterized protein